MTTITNTLNPEEKFIQPSVSQEEIKKHARRGNMIYISITGCVFAALFILFLFFPKPTYSELEKRDLKTFPEFNAQELSSYPGAISEWFSDSQPYRDDFLTLSMGLRNAMKFNFRSDEDAVSFIATSDGMAPDSEESETIDDRPETETHDPNSLIEENAKIGNSGVIVAGTAPNARAMMAYGGTATSGGGYISMVNKYAATFPDATMYVVIANTAGEFYMPEKVSQRNKPQTATLNHVKESLAPGVKYVDVWSALNAHKAEDIFSRTDHHWAPLGAYYAAKAFAQTAGVPFKNLDSYEKHVVRDYVGSMYGYSKDINVKNSPEDFVYFTPKNVNYTSDFISYTVDANYKITKTSGPYKSEFFKSFNDGNGNAYCTFMGGDRFTVHVKTDSPSSRKLLVIKDSYGNAVPGYLFYGFSDIHVVDFRYFNKNMKKYVTENGITDIAFIFSIFKVCSGGACKQVENFLTQEDGKLNGDSYLSKTLKPGSSEKSEKTNKVKDIVKDEEKEDKPSSTPPASGPEGEPE